MGSNYTQQYYAEDLSANGGLRSIRVKLPEGTTHMKLECPASAWNNGNGGKLHTCWANAKLYETVEIAVTGITLDQGCIWALKVGGTGRAADGDAAGSDLPRKTRQIKKFYGNLIMRKSLLLTAELSQLIKREMQQLK